VPGDITDAKLEDREGSQQFEDEWRQYDKVLHDTGILDKTVWLDTRGNHGVYMFSIVTSTKEVTFLHLFICVLAGKLKLTNFDEISLGDGMCD